ncbi:MAG: orotidine-5'-phosphate decarboxylase [Chloroflexi bacterium]|nr:orotidine-5'-phosphate decarboxylase [Chloroflexota bacterium]
MTYLEKLHAVQEKNHSWLCVGLDPDPQRLRVDVFKWDEPVLPFNKAIIDATADLVCAYKPNLGFYLQWGAAGIIALERTIAYVPAHIPVILDCKTGDIGHTQAAWARGLFEEWGVDAVTVNPFVGAEAVLPMIGGRPDKAVYLLARTSNPSASDFREI